MNFEALVERFSKVPLIESSLLRSHFPDERQMAVQLSRWQKAGKLLQLTRGLYALAERYRRTDVSEFYVAARLKEPSYISLEKALEYHGVIPEAVSVTTCVTSKRPARYETPLGIFDYRHIQSALFWGYASVTLRSQTGFVALPEKAFLDLVYLKHIEVSMEYLKEMRLDNLEKFDRQRLLQFAQRFEKPRISKAAQCFLDYLHREKKGMAKIR